MGIQLHYIVQMVKVDAILKIVNVGSFYEKNEFRSIKGSLEEIC